MDDARSGQPGAAPASAGRAIALWWLPLLAAVLPLAATSIAYRLSLHLALVPDCNPFVDGCVSISRAARHDLPNILFRALMLPAAVLQGLSWLLCPAWLRSLGAAPDRLQRAVPWLGVAAALFLVLYGTFLGTEGDGYRWMRRYGVIVYFACTCIAMLVVSDAMRRAMHGGRRHIARALLAACAGLPLLGLVHAVLPLALPAEAARDAVQNATEWWAGAVFTLFFAVLAWAWRATGFAGRLETSPGPPQGPATDAWHGAHRRR